MSPTLQMASPDSDLEDTEVYRVEIGLNSPDSLSGSAAGSRPLTPLDPTTEMLLVSRTMGLPLPPPPKPELSTDQESVVNMNMKSRARKFRAPNAHVEGADAGGGA